MMNAEVLIKKLGDKIYIKYNYKIYELPNKVLAMCKIAETIGENWTTLEDKELMDMIIKKIQNKPYDFEFNILNYLDKNHKLCKDNNYNVQIVISNSTKHIVDNCINVIFSNDYCYIFFGDGSFLDIEENSKTIEKSAVNYAILKALDFYILEDKKNCFYELETSNFICNLRNKKMQFISYDSNIQLEIEKACEVNQDDKYSSIINFYRLFSNKLIYKGFTDEKQIPLKFVECQYRNGKNDFSIYGIGLTPMIAVLNLYKNIIKGFNSKLYVISNSNDFDTAIALEIYHNHKGIKKIMRINCLEEYLTSKFDKIILERLYIENEIEVEFLKLDIDYYYLALRVEKEIIFEEVSTNINLLAESLLYKAYCFYKYKNEFKMDQIISIDKQSKFKKVEPNNMSLNIYLEKNDMSLYASLVRVPSINNLLPILTLNLKETDYE